jgi:hypothetical protein
MNRQEFIQERMKGNPLNQFDMTKDGYHNYLRTQTSILWFVEFPDGSWIEETKLRLTSNPLAAYPFRDELTAQMFIKHYSLDVKWGAIATEHKFVSSDGKEN